MALIQVNTSDFDYAMMLEVINLSYKTQSDITLTNYTTTGVPAIQSGSIFVNNGAQIKATANEAINDSGVANGWVYVKYSTSNERFEYTITAPTWSHPKQGYYSTNDRYFFKMYKVGAADFRYKLKFSIFNDVGRYFENTIFRNYVSETGNNIFDDLTYLLPNTNDRILTKGISSSASSNEPLGMLERFDADTIVSKSGGGANLDAIDDGSATTFTTLMLIEYITL